MLQDLLRTIPWFTYLDAAQISSMAASMAQRHLAAGDILFHHGEESYDCFIIVEGSVEVLIYVNGAEHRLEVYNAGDIVGEMALIDRSPRSASVRAITDSHLVVITEVEFKTLIGSNPEVAMRVLRNSTTRVRNTNQRMIGDLERKNNELLRAYQQLKAAQGDLIRLSRIEQELAVARQIQESFLPRQLPQLRGWEIGAYSRGAQAVGGDFYDCIELSDGRIGLVVADACGKGVTAALFVALSRSLLRAASQAPWIFQSGEILDAESILTGALWLVNDYICREHGDNNMFVTLFYAVLDPKNGDLAYVNAGHNPPLLLDAQCENLYELPEATLPIGIMANQNFPPQRTRIEPGYRLVLFSDGITEAMNPDGQPFGDERFHEVLYEDGHLSAKNLVSIVIAQVDSYAAGAPQADDMTLMIIAREA
ncbi:stage II sporulation E family protein [Oscillochloris trichoides DG-6]|uniref:Stage II sporulation E family protein n=1 Tax=Oscillochloris trichoides DG-6 TaxID=765420 RepID=E1IB92_9CHLR|nr:SpoIIE family protein phosphatase [Oscillochloris trichoides]EFO81577.1 stage II sporulation E family protein [Oscillochloris trichoides DG-6]